ncbi:MAG: hypothetical protein Kow0092_26630 [Deferrisomatales bacterium]
MGFRGVPFFWVAVGVLVCGWGAAGPPRALCGETAERRGVGAVIREVGGQVVLEAVVPGGPAERGGLEAGDVLRAVDGRETAGVPLAQVAEWITGPVGTWVELTVWRPREGGGAVRQVRLQRGRLPEGGDRQGREGERSPPAPSPAPREVPGLEPVPGGLGSGQVLVARLSGAASASGALARLLERARPLFQGPVVLLHAFRDREDRHAQVAFRGASRDGPVAGLAVAVRGEGGEGAVGLLFDRPDRLPRSLDALVAAFRRGAGVSAGAGEPREPVRWYTAPFPDGSGSIRLPVGWAVTSSYQGAVDVAGPGGERMSLGVGIPVATPPAATNPVTGAPMPGAVVAWPMDPVSALHELVPRIDEVSSRWRPGSPRLEGIRLVEWGPIGSPTGGQAALLLWDYTLGGRPYRALSAFDCSPVSAGWWTFYYSTVTAPRERFARQLPTLVEAWASGWRIDPRVFRERMRSALESMKETHRLLTEAHRTRTRAVADRLADWTEVFRGSCVVRDTLVQEDAPVDIGWSRQIVEKLNERAGYPRYVEIPLRRLYTAR